MGSEPYLVQRRTPQHKPLRIKDRTHGFACSSHFSSFSSSPLTTQRKCLIHTSCWKAATSPTRGSSKTLTEGLPSRCQYTPMWPPKITPRADIDLYRRSDMEQKPNLLVRLMREPQWSQQHPDIMGPDTCFMYFGPGKSSGYLVYGNGPNQPMNSSVRQKKNVPKCVSPLPSSSRV